MNLPRDSATFHVDVDALCKMAHWGVLPILPEIFGTNWAAFAVTSSLKFRAQRAIAQPDKKLFFTAQAAQIAFDCISQMSPAGSPDPRLLEQFDVAQIDPGEAVQFALAATGDNTFVLTGDKRAIRGLAKISQASLLTGKVICLEQILARCFVVKGRDWLLQHVCPWRTVDKAISNVMGSRCDAPSEAIVEGLASYINELRDLVDPSLLAAWLDDSRE